VSNIPGRRTVHTGETNVPTWSRPDFSHFQNAGSDRGQSAASAETRLIRRGAPRPPVRSLLHAAGIATGPEPSPAVDSIRQAAASLPLSELWDTSSASGRYCTVTTVDSRGRLADRTPLRALGWGPGTSVRAAADPRGGVVTVRVGGETSISKHGHLCLPAPIRRSCRMRAGDRLLVLADLIDVVLLAYLPHAVDAMIAMFHAERPAEQS
jgi:hypothetical protein